ncbi:hypothetical protein ACHAW5_009046 [Stephanodiscus triporus]|uniref:Uncharacterized protein n=1 Tax=Stephanodiscus triporus TaxID=2934178 RepID=A0ABD3MPK8_9STRA
MVSHPNEYAPVATPLTTILSGIQMRYLRTPHDELALALPHPVRFPEWAVTNVMGFEYHGSRGGCGTVQEPSETDGGEQQRHQYVLGDVVIPWRQRRWSRHRHWRSHRWLSWNRRGRTRYGGMDVERGGLLLEDKEEISPPSTLSGGGVKKRSPMAP